MALPESHTPEGLYRVPSDEDQDPPLFFYLSQSQMDPEVSSLRPEKGKEREGGRDSEERELRDVSHLRPKHEQSMGDSADNYHIPKFGFSGNFDENGTEVDQDVRKSRRNLKRSLLVSGMQEEGEVNIASSVVKERKYQDVLFTVLFWICFVSMFVVSLTVHVQGLNTWKPIEGSIRDMLFLALTESSMLIFFLLFVGILFGAIMLFFFRNFLKTTVWATLLSMPVAFLASSIWCFVFSASPQKGTNSLMITLGVLSLLGCFGMAGFIHLMRNRIKTSIEFLSLACKVLQDRPGIFLVSFLCSLVYLIFTAFWYWNFSWAFMLGHKEAAPPDQAVWILHPESYLVSTFLVFVYLWTSSLMNYIQTYIISEVTCGWYYHRNDFSFTPQQQMSQAVRHALTTSFGSICLASLVYSFFRLIQFVLRQFSRALSRGNSRAIMCCVGCLESIITLIDSVNKFALAYAALSGESFCTSNKVSFSIFRRNLLDRFAVSAISHFIVKIWVYAVSLLFGLSILTYSVNSVGTIYGWAAGALTGLISYFVLQFYSNLILNIVDSLFMCYAIDCDVNSTLLGVQNTPNVVVHETLEGIIRSQQNVVIYHDEEEAN